MSKKNKYRVKNGRFSKERWQLYIVYCQYYLPLGVSEPPALSAVAVGQVHIVGLCCQHLVGCNNDVVTPYKSVLGETSKDLLV